MAQPVWATASGSLGVVPEGVFFQTFLLAYATIVGSTSAGNSVIFNVTDFYDIEVGDELISTNIPAGTLVTAIDFNAATITMSAAATGDSTGAVIGYQGGELYYQVIAGQLPDGIQCTANGMIVGVPLAVASLQGIPTEVSEDVTSKFTVRAYTETVPPRIRDRTFTLTVTGNDVPEFITPAGSLGTFYDGDQLNIQIQYTDTDPNETVVCRVVGGELPGGITVSSTGLISGYIRPAANINEPAGYDITPNNVLPYDFLVSAINKNYQFTLEITDGKSSNLRTFEFFVYDRSTMTADTTEITADSTTVTADETTERRPFLTNATPSNLGVVRGDNYYAYQFIGNDYDTPLLKYAIAVNEGNGLPPGLGLDPNSGWYYGYVPDQGVTEVEYSFNITVYQSEFTGDPIVCTATAFGTNLITCADTSQLGPGQPIVFTGTTFGGITASETLVYYVVSVISNTEFTVTTNLNTNTVVTLSNGAGSMTANLVVASDPYPFLITISGAVDAEVTWLTPEDLGVLDNGDTSLLVVQAVNRGGRELTYRLTPGAFNSLPQGLELLPTGEISGRVSFNTFAIDLGSTTIDNNTTTWDSEYEFSVNAYAQDLNQIVYEVDSVTVVSGGSGYSGINLPVITFNTPIGATAVTAQAGNVTVSGGAITAVDVADSGAGYTSTATVTVTEGFGGSGADLVAVMRETGVRDVVSVNKVFRVRVRREYNAPYQNIEVQAMPPENDRVLVAQLLNNEDIFVPDYIFRPDDPYFGKSSRVVYQHAFGLAPDILDTYVESLYLNHYWKNLVLGQIQTAQARDPVTGEVVYEVVYSQIIDDLVNNAGESVGKIVNLGYPIIDPTDGSTVLTQVYPNSLVNMRNQVIDVVGQISTKLPLWMTSKQANGRVLGFTPAWVLCYTKPGRSNQIAYYIQTQFGEQLNRVDFKVDRYILDRELSRNWDTVTQDWTPEPNLTTFDRFDTAGYTYLGEVEIATNLAYADVNNRTIDYINNLGGLDGVISNIDGNKLIFVKQENYNGPPGSNYSNANDAWQQYLYPYDSGVTTGGPGSFDVTGESFDEAVTIPKGTLISVTNTTAGSNNIVCDDTSELLVNQEIYFTGTVFGGIVADTVYFVKQIVNGTTFRISATAGGPTFALSTASGTMVGRPANQRMGIYEISVDPVTTFVTLTLLTQTEVNDFVNITRGNFYRSAQLYYPSSPGPGLTDISWLALVTVTTTETTFDQNSVAFEEPLDMYDPTDQYDKYLVFPKTNILE